MRTRAVSGAGMAAVVLVLLVPLVSAGCGTDPTAAPTAAPARSQSSPASMAPTALKPSRMPAAAAGGACQLLDYAIVEQALGVSFEVAAGGQQDATRTCVLQRTGTTVPDLTLAVTPSSVDPATFRRTMVPKGGTAVTGLGNAGYRKPVAAAPRSGRGPGVEVGWLSGNKRILVLRCTLPADANPQAAAELGEKLVELARQVDQKSV